MSYVRVTIKTEGDLSKGHRGQEVFCQGGNHLFLPLHVAKYCNTKVIVYIINGNITKGLELRVLNIQ